MAGSADSANAQKVRLVLASQSPRRREILDMMGLKGKFETTPSPLDESALQMELLSTTDPADYVRILAEQKALALAEVLRPPESIGTTIIVLGGDTIVAFDGCILEKPVNPADAERMLSILQGNQHDVHTGVALVRFNSGGEHVLLNSFTDTAKVQFAALSEADIATYVATGEPLDKAGSYGIQGIGGQMVSSIEGDFFTVR